MRSVLTVVVLLLAAAMLTGMGGLGGTPEGTLPKTEENIKARVVDRAGVSTELSRFSMDGKVYLEGRHGEAVMDVLFHDLKEVVFGQVTGDYVAAELSLASGARHQLRVPKSDVFYGDAGYGVYRIPAHDISRIDFHK